MKFKNIFLQLFIFLYLQVEKKKKVMNKWCVNQKIQKQRFK